MADQRDVSDGSGAYFVTTEVRIGKVPQDHRPSDQPPTYYVDSASLTEREVIPQPPEPVDIRLRPADPSARPLWRVSDWSMYPEHRLLEFTDVGAEFGSPDNFPDRQNWLLQADDWLVLDTADAIHQPEITLEAWESAPPIDDEVWDRELTTMVRFRSGEIQWEATTSGYSAAPTMRLAPAKKGRYYLRIRVRGTEEAERRSEAVVDTETEDEIVGVEQWRLQFWPVKPRG